MIQLNEDPDTAYEAALEATTRVMQISMVDFLS